MFDFVENVLGVFLFALVLHVFCFCSCVLSGLLCGVLVFYFGQGMFFFVMVFCTLFLFPLLSPSIFFVIVFC